MVLLDLLGLQGLQDLMVLLESQGPLGNLGFLEHLEFLGSLGNLVKQEKRAHLVLLVHKADLVYLDPQVSVVNFPFFANHNHNHTCPNQIASNHNHIWHQNFTTTTHGFKILP